MRINRLKRTKGSTTAVAIVAVFGVALLCRFVYLLPRWASSPEWNVDALGYHQIALNLLERGAFSLNSAPPFQPDAIRTPGYPAFIAACYLILGRSPQLVLVVQAIVDSLTALLIMGMAWRLTPSLRVSMLGGMVYALYPAAWRYCAEFYVEIVLAFCLALTFYSLIRVLTHQDKAQLRHAFALATGCALSIMVKPNVALLPLILQLQIELAQEARQIIARYPLAFVKSHLKGVLRGIMPQEHRFWFEMLSGQSWDTSMPDGMLRKLTSSQWRSVPMLAISCFGVFAIAHIALYLGAALGAWRIRKTHLAVACAACLTIGYMLFLPGPIAYERFRLPVMPLFCVLLTCASAKVRIDAPSPAIH